MTIQKKITGMVFVALFVLGVSGVALYTVINKPNKPTGTGDASLIYDPSDNRQVVGAHHNIFTGKVLQKLEPSSYDAIAQTQYLVEVVENIKGSLSGKVAVSQLDGLMFADDEGKKPPVLEVGSAYVFATRENPKTGWNVLSAHPSGIKLLSEDKSLNTDKLFELSKNDPGVNELREAYPQEIIPPADLVSGNVRNAYRDLPKEVE